MTDQQESGRATSAEAAAARRARRIGGGGANAASSPTDVAAPVDAPNRPRPERPGPAAPVSTRKRETSASEVPTGTEETPVIVRTVTPAWVNWLPAAVLSAGALVLAVLIIVLSNGVWWGPSPSAAPTGAQSPNAVRERVLAAAKTCVASTNSYKYTALDAYEKKALACSTGQFTSQLQNTIETLIKVNAPKLKSSQTAQINRGGIEAVTSDGRQWTVLLFGQLTVVNTNDPKGRTDPFAAQVIMQKTGNQWLIAHLSTVSTPLS
ncbi:MAG TPA: hypothetical protein VKB75_00455 [Jatrophihabitans sp.]|nr:hypothetical protein [Jatrophihabitans sp.]